MGRTSQLGDLEELVLLAALRGAPATDGSSVRRILAEEADRRASVSTIYVTLMRLEEKGYVTSSMGAPSGQRGGKARRLFAVTDEGRAALASRREVRDRLWNRLGAGDTPAPAEGRSDA